ncbi:MULTISPECIES: LCP family protein [unclassified Enterococcus]|uniref:LCP family protein n=1 Tax=unclassified Enterococcus TaxID=2608891 RepID=UPI0013EA7C9A|nr:MULTISPECIES: LCP family protein [unclassified Enterococcus]
MSRMDRYKDIHKKAKPLKRAPSSFFARRERQERKEEQLRREDATRIYQNHQQTSDDFHDEGQWSDDQQRAYANRPLEDIQTRKKGFFRKRAPKIKQPRKRRSWKRIIFGILFFLIAYSAISFFVGKFVAEHDSSLTPATVETFNGVKASNGAHNVLILGSDTRGEDAGRADTIMVLQLDGPSHKPKLISFMRDSFVTIPGVGQNKINSAYAYGGADLVRQTLSENFGIDCQYYAKVDFHSFEKVIDALFMNGVKIDAEKDLNLDGVDIKKGTQRMDGHVLLQYARFRMDEEGDFGRVRRQQQVMNAIFSQLKNPLNLIRAPYAAGKALGYTSTDVTSLFLAKNLFSIARGAAGIDRLSVPVEGSWNYGQSDYAGSILSIDNQMNQSAIDEFLNK